jgi:hypothetical protein
MRTGNVWLFVLAAQGLAFGVSAQEPYVVGAAGRSNWSYGCGPNGCQRSTTAWRVAAGYRFNSAVAWEAFHIDLGRARSSDFSADGDLSATGTGVQALLGWQFGDVDLAAKLGLARMTNEFHAAPSSSYASVRVQRNEFVGGLMGAYRVTPSVSVRLDLDIVTVALNGDALFYSRGLDVTAVLLGVMFRF